MALLLYRLGKFSYRHRWLVVSLWLAVLLAVGGSAAAFHGTMSNNFQIPGTETQQMLDKLKKELPESSGGSAGIVFEAGDTGFSQAGKDAVATALKELRTLPDVQGTVDPFETQAQLDAAPAEVTAGEARLASGQVELDTARDRLEAGRTQLAGAEQQMAAAGLSAEAIQAQLAPQRAQLAEGQAKLDAGAKEAADGAAALALAKRQLTASQGLRFVSADGKAAIAQVQFKTSINGLTPPVRQQVQDIVHEVSSAGITALASKEITEDVSQMFGVSEIIGIAVAALVLIVMLGTLIASGLPLLMALIGVAVGVGGTFALTGVVDMSSISPMLALMLGLAVGIDYSLFIVNRHRAQLLSGMDAEESAALATGTSGNAVLFAGLTVVIALAALVVPGLPFLAVMGLSAAATVAVAVVVSLTLTPAVLSLIGRRLISKRAWAKATRHNAEPGHEAEDLERAEKRSSGGWGGLVTRHPWTALLAGVVLLGVLALPASQLRLALPDGGSEPVDSQAFKAYDLTRTSFGEGMTGPIVVVGEFPAGLSEDEAKNKQFDVADELRSVDNVIAAVPLALSNDRRTAVFQVIPREGPASASTVQVVSELRAKGAEIKSTTGTTIGLTGQTAGNIDVSAKLGAALPPYLAIVVGLSLILLLLVFRSIVVPLLATGGFLLSLAAAFGAVVAVYQWGWLGAMFDVANPGAVLSFLPIILIGVLFGLAMDYQVFITSGMRESFMHGESARHAVRSGFSHAAAVVTAAAIIMVSVFAGFIFSHLTMVRPLGFAMAFGVLVDAFVVRMTIVPAVMYLLGEKAWWLPRWLSRVLPDVDVEGASLERTTAAGTAAGLKAPDVVDSLPEGTGPAQLERVNDDGSGGLAELDGRAGPDEMISLYAGGMTAHDIEHHLASTTGTELSPGTVSKITSEVLDEFLLWQQRPLKAFYPVIHFDALEVTIQDGTEAQNKTAHLAVGVDLDGVKHILGIWIQATESATFWAGVGAELANRGVGDVLIVCGDGPAGFPETITAAWPDSMVQNCALHLLRASMRSVGYGQRKAVTDALKPVHQAVDADAGRAALDAFAASELGRKNPHTARVFEDAWERFIPFLEFPPKLRRTIYTTNAVESLNVQLRRTIKNHDHFPSGDMAVKLFWLAICNLEDKVAKDLAVLEDLPVDSKRNTTGRLIEGQPTANWKQALAQLTVAYPERVNPYLHPGTRTAVTEDAVRSTGDEVGTEVGAGEPETSKEPAF